MQLAQELKKEIPVIQSKIADENLKREQKKVREELAEQKKQALELIEKLPQMLRDANERGERELRIKSWFTIKPSSRTKTDHIDKDDKPQGFLKYIIEWLTKEGFDYYIIGDIDNGRDLSVLYARW